MINKIRGFSSHIKIYLDQKAKVSWELDFYFDFENIFKTDYKFFQLFPYI